MTSQRKLALLQILAGLALVVVFAHMALTSQSRPWLALTAGVLLVLLGLKVLWQQRGA
ncbi:MAG TPA: hypothetical protein PKJ56_03620 [Promineifilum sp.]|nr:hypothetical protein [Promineifilum sp.]